MCLSHCVRVATVTTRTTRSCAPNIRSASHQRSGYSFSLFSLHDTLPVLASAPLLLCAFAPRLDSARLLLCSDLISALLSVLHFSLRCSSICSALYGDTVHMYRLHAITFLCSSQLKNLSFVNTGSSNFQCLCSVQYFKANS